MAINPNTTFSSGGIFTADQANRFPRGVMSYVEHTSSTGFTTETTILTATAFTAVASRYYRITYFEPSLANTAIGYSLMKIKQGATVLVQGNIANPAATTGYAGSVSVVKTFSAGSVTLTATMQSTATGSAQAAATYPGYLLVEDIGPA
jgi:hypothetical protein